MLLKGKSIIVTGGVTGIGKATVLAMVREGAAVVSTSRTSPESERAIKVINAAKELGAGPVTHIQMDVTKQNEVDKGFQNAVAFLGGLDAIVNSAGIEQQKPAEDLVEADLYEQFAGHVLGTAFTNAAAFRYMKDKGGSIVNYASYAGVCGMMGMPAYSAAKAGVIGYTRCVAKDWAKHWIRTNVVCPAVMTELGETWLSEMSEERLAEIAAWKKATIWLGGDLGKAEDAAHLNVFLASDMSRFINGQTIGVDGGMMMSR